MCFKSGRSLVRRKEAHQRMSPEEQLLRLEKEFAKAVVKNDLEAIARFVADNWIIIDADGGIVDKVRFLTVVKSHHLMHELMESEDIRVRVYGDNAVVTTLARTQEKEMSQDV